MKIIKPLIAKLYTSKLKSEYDNRKFIRFNERPVEYSFVFRMLSKYYPKTVLDVGTGTTALPHLIHNCGILVTAIDNITDYWPSGMFNRHYYVKDDSVLKPKLTEKHDMVFCISTLEHIEDNNLAVKNMAGLLNVGGHLVMSFPSSPKPYIRNCYDLEDSSYGKGNPYIAQSFTQENIDNWCQKYGLQEAESEYWQFWTNDYWTCGDQIIPPLKTDANGKYQIRCICLKKI